MADPMIVVNEYAGGTGHTNMSFYDSNGVLLGTYGGNINDIDLNPFNGLAGGVYNEPLSDRPSPPINTTEYSLSQTEFNSLYDQVQNDVYQTSIGNGAYFALGQNCVDVVTGWLDSASISFSLTDLYTGTILDMYATVVHWATVATEWISDALDFNHIYSDETADLIDELYEDYETSKNALGGSEIEDDMGALTQELLHSYYSPIAIDLNGSGLETTYFTTENVTFDINGDGIMDKVAWLSPEDAFLAVDRNGDKQVNDGSELFGGTERGEGYAELALFDSNQDGQLTIDDEEFNQLLVWQDANSNGVSDDGELFTLEAANIDSISILYETRDEYDHGNLIGEHSYASIDDEIVVVGDIYFKADLGLL